MLSRLLRVLGALAVPGLLAGQTSRTTPAPPTAKPHGVAIRVQGEVVAAPVMIDETDGQNNQEGIDEADGQNNQEGVDEADGQNNQEGVDEVDGANNQGGADEPDGQNGQVGAQADQAGQDQGNAGNPAPPQAAGATSRVGRHKP